MACVNLIAARVSDVTLTRIGIEGMRLCGELEHF